MTWTPGVMIGNRLLKFGNAKPVKIGEVVEAEALRRRAQRKCWAVIDLHGDVVTLVWFGTTAKMMKLQQQLKGLPKIGMAILSQGGDSSQIEAALYVNEQPSKRARSTRKRRGTK